MSFKYVYKTMLNAIIKSNCFIMTQKETQVYIWYNDPPSILNKDVILLQGRGEPTKPHTPNICKEHLFP